ncbi:MAG TPA: MlaD family protein [Burkholderiaceae bacterium]|nr:MlaD family protein [Burkholderiaceae bacterium]
MENRSHALAAGAFVLAVMALLVALAFWLTRDNAVRRTYEISSRDAVTGLQVQAGVRFRGVTVGRVTDIGFDPATTGNVLVRISVDDNAPITRSTYATLGFQGVTGLAFVQLDDSGESREALPSGAAKPERIPIRPSLLSRLSDQGVVLLNQLEETSKRVNLLLAPENQKSLMGAIDGMSQAASSVQKLAANADKVLDAQLGPQKVNIPKLAEETTATLKSMQGASDRVGTSADEARDSAAAFKRVTERMSAPGGTLDQVTQGIESLTATGQTLNAGTLPRLNRTVDEAARAVRQVGKTVSAVNDNPQSLIYGNGPVLPGPGEPGFTTPGGKP